MTINMTDTVCYTANTRKNATFDYRIPEIPKGSTKISNKEDAVCVGILLLLCWFTVYALFFAW